MQTDTLHRTGRRPPLDRFVEQLWYWEGAPPAHAKDRLLPTGSASLIINLAEDEIRNYSGAATTNSSVFPAPCWSARTRATS